MFYRVESVLDFSSKGWLSCELSGGENIELCYKTKVSFVADPKKQKVFEILEGNYKNQKARLINSKDWFRFEQAEVEESANFQLITSENVLRCKEFGDFEVILGKNKIPKKKYQIQIPSYRHPKTPKLYQEENLGGSRFSETWFELRSNTLLPSNHFLHFGRFSEGCITFPFIAKSTNGRTWNKLYSYLLNSRLADSLLGTIEVM